MHCKVIHFVVVHHKWAQVPKEKIIPWRYTVPWEDWKVFLGAWGSDEFLGGKMSGSGSRTIFFIVFNGFGLYSPLVNGTWCRGPTAFNLLFCELSFFLL